MKDTSVSESRPVHLAGLLAAALSPGTSPNKRQRELVQASLIARGVPEQVRRQPRR
jgi:hypothetical protein